MKKLIFRLVFPLTFFSYFLIEKWWYVLIIDAIDVKMTGFPLINCSPTMASSMDFEFYILETIINILCFFMFWFCIVYIINRYIKPIFISKILGIVSSILLSLYTIGFICITIIFNEYHFKLKTDRKIEIMDTGYLWFWQMPPQLDYNKYHPKKKE